MSLISFCNTTATGGNITIDTGVLAALEDSDITADAPEGFGGQITIDAQGIFGTEPRDAQTPESDITATGAISGVSQQSHVFSSAGF